MRCRDWLVGWIIGVCFVLASCTSERGLQELGVVSGRVILDTHVEGLSVWVEGSGGRMASGTIGPGGEYSIQAPGLEPPYLVSVSLPGGRSYYALHPQRVGQGVDVSVLSDVLARAWFRLRGDDEVLQSRAERSVWRRWVWAKPQPVELELMRRQLVQGLFWWFDDVGSRPGEVDPFSISGIVDANVRERFAESLREIRSNGDGSVLSWSDGSVSRRLDLDVYGLTGELNVRSTASGQNGETTVVARTVIPFGEGLRTVETLMEALEDSVGGSPELQWVSMMAALDAEPLPPARCVVASVAAVETEEDTVEAVLACASGKKGEWRIGDRVLFHRVDDQWLVERSEVAKTSVIAHAHFLQSSSGAEGFLQVEVVAEVPAGVAEGVSIGGINEGSILDLLPYDIQGGNSDVTVFGGDLIVPLGAVYSLADSHLLLTGSNGEATRQAVVLGAVTSETVRFKNLPVSGFSTEHHLDRDLDVEWTVPETFAVRSARLHAVAHGGSTFAPELSRCELEGQIVAMQQGIGRIYIPGLCNHVAVRKVEIRLEVEGVRGERSETELVLEPSVTPTEKDGFLQRAYSLLAAEGILRDSSREVVESLPCDVGDAQAIDRDAPPECIKLEVQHLGGRYSGYLLSKGRSQLTIYVEGHCYCERKSLAGAICAGSGRFMRRVLDVTDVLFLDMPLMGINGGQTFTEISDAESDPCNHWLFGQVDRAGESGLAYFVSYIPRLVDEFAGRYERISIVGRSGGGWTATLMGALDPRFAISISIAGTLPLGFRGPELDGRDDSGDWEQSGARAVRMVDYDTLYALAARDGRRHIQYFNEFDLCCFSGTKGKLAAAAFAAEFGDDLDVSFRVVEGEVEHAIPIEAVVLDLSGA
jgi:pimeloyl-ACP methyl ester carboxylesterase